MKDVVAYVETGAGKTGERSFSMTSTTASPSNFSATNITSVTNGGGNSIHADWTVTDHETATTVAGLAHTIYDDTGGAAI